MDETSEYDDQDEDFIQPDQQPDHMTIAFKRWCDGSSQSAFITEAFAVGWRAALRSLDPNQNDEVEHELKLAKEKLAEQAALISKLQRALDEDTMDLRDSKEALKDIEQNGSVPFEQLTRIPESSKYVIPGSDLEDFFVRKDREVCMTEDQETACYKAFCISNGYGWPVEPSHEWFAEKLWDETPGLTFRYGWLAGRQYQSTLKIPVTPYPGLEHEWIESARDSLKDRAHEIAHSSLKEKPEWILDKESDEEKL